MTGVRCQVTCDRGQVSAGLCHVSCFRCQVSGVRCQVSDDCSGAGSGVGRSLSVELASRGYSLALWDINMVGQRMNTRASHLDQESLGTEGLGTEAAHP